jgi:hypothetical protein
MALLIANNQIIYFLMLSALMQINEASGDYSGGNTTDVVCITATNSNNSVGAKVTRKIKNT